MEDQWLTWAKRLQAIASTGLHYGQDDFDRERYREIEAISQNMMMELGNTPIERIADLVSDSYKGYQTPKIDVRGAVFKDHKVLLVQERSDGLWSLPGGFADIGRSAAENVVKEVWEEATIEVDATHLYGVRHKAKHAYDPDIRDFYKLHFLCRQTDTALPEPGPETMATAYFPLGDLPDLSKTRVIESDIEAAFAFYEGSHAAHNIRLTFRLRRSRTGEPPPIHISDSLCKPGSVMRRLSLLVVLVSATLVTTEAPRAQTPVFLPAYDDHLILPFACPADDDLAWSKAYAQSIAGLGPGDDVRLLYDNGAMAPAKLGTLTCLRGECRGDYAALSLDASPASERIVAVASSSHDKPVFPLTAAETPDSCLGLPPQSEDPHGFGFPLTAPLCTSHSLKIQDHDIAILVAGHGWDAGEWLADLSVFLSHRWGQRGFPALVRVRRGDSRARASLCLERER